jgi:hypothetical protein
MFLVVLYIINSDVHVFVLNGIDLGLKIIVLTQFRVQHMETDANQLVMNLLRRFGTLSFRHLLAITEFDVITLKQTLHNLIVYSKIQSNTEIAPKEGLIEYFEIIGENITINTSKIKSQQEITSDLTTDDSEDSVLSTA